MRIGIFDFPYLHLYKLRRMFTVCIQILPTLRDFYSFYYPTTICASFDKNSVKEYIVKISGIKGINNISAA